MKRTIITIVLALFIALSVSNSLAQKQEQPSQVELYNQAPLMVNFARVEGDTPTYVIVGMIDQCSQLLDVQSVSVCVKADNSRYYGSYVDSAVKPYGDSCAVEFFAYEFDGLSLQEQFDKPGPTFIVMQGATGMMFLELPTEVEDILWDIILPPTYKIQYE